MDAFTEHGALWRMTRDGLPRLRSNATIDYPWNSWVAGAPINDSSLPARDNSSPVGDGSHPAFDIFATFSFPPFMTFGRPQADIPDGTYIIRFVPPGGSTGRNNFLALESQGPNPAVDPLAITIHSPKDQWRIFRVPGTDMYAIRHVVTSRLLGSKWPVKVNQNMIGARTPDQLGFTTRFAAIRDPQGNVNFRITSQSDLEEDLFLASSLTTDASTSRIPVVLQFKGFDTPAWSLESV
ncbi:hypothetical protein PHLGIDRAFT_20312 [Phlebiopsis gigantea 11061_1 CR5-6]|uniref:Aldos-2-ulose dehydratase/isomerase (AUDH) Cupin domain-containing protein n=1 Tax=Phlebiopsis gigantea (strain 11061_1 CR5-6) TaxID=745531 RepID=A0A0C3NEP5_PHLG1|nr:hypothetical protein PHLGIDRAFT_20312 [Phlebiopsis gigantea 11061_1 CR5-6]